MSSSHSTRLPATGVHALSSYSASLTALGHALATAFRNAFAGGREPALDDATLRDLGLSRSELASYQAEAEGRVEATRRRIVNQGS
jgi:hypothetical protein